MATVSDTAYPRLPGTLASSDLKTLFSVTRRERRWLSSLRVGRSARRDTAIYLNCLQSLGYFPRSSAISGSVVRFVSSELKLEPFSCISPNRRSSHRIKQAVRDSCQIKLFSSKAHRPWLFELACQMAVTKESPIDIIKWQLGNSEKIVP